MIRQPAPSQGIKVVSPLLEPVRVIDHLPKGHHFMASQAAMTSKEFVSSREGELVTVFITLLMNWLPY